MRDTAGYPLQDRLCQEIAYELGIEVPNISDRLFYLADRFIEKVGRRGKFDLYRKARNIYEQSTVPEIYRFLSQIPFHLVLSSSPSHLLREAFESMNIPHQFDFYNYKRNQESVVSPSKNHPLIYNLLGSERDEQSMVFSNGDHLEYLSAILGASPLATEIQKSLTNATNILFVGFDFESRGTDILLRLFDSHNKEVNYSVASRLPIQAERRELLQNHFKMEFQELNMNEYIQEIHSRCEENGLLRELRQESLKDQITQLIKVGKLDDAISFLEDYLETEYPGKKGGEELLNEGLSLSASYNSLQRKILTGSITDEESTIERQRITEALLKLSEETSIPTDKQSTFEAPDPEKLVELKEIPKTRSLSAKRQQRRLERRDWKLIHNYVEDERCILVLGPDAMMDTNGRSLQDNMCQMLAQELRVSVPNSPEKLLHLGDTLTQERGWRKLLSDVAHEAYSQVGNQDIYRKLARIPFHLILSASPDKNVSTAFEEQELLYEFAYYKSQSNTDLKVSPNRITPLIYNLLGEIDDANSMVLTHESLYKHILAVSSGSSPFPDALRMAIQSARIVLFLGFDFENWHWKMLFKQLGLDNDELYAYAYTSKYEQLSPYTEEMYENNFKIQFIEQDTQQFIDELYNACEARGILR